MRQLVFQRRARWAQIFTDGRMPLECGTGQRLILTNVTYEQQGQYICLASNKINGNVREVKSDPVSLQVVGAPRVRRIKPTIFMHFSRLFRWKRALRCIDTLASGFTNSGVWFVCTRDLKCRISQHLPYCLEVMNNLKIINFFLFLTETRRTTLAIVKIIFTYGWFSFSDPFSSETRFLIPLIRCKLLRY